MSTSSTILRADCKVTLQMIIDAMGSVDATTVISYEWSIPLTQDQIESGMGENIKQLYTHPLTPEQETPKK